jgi:hypothetical protein
MELEKARYILRYYDHLMTMQERLAQRHLMGTLKVTRGRSDANAQREVSNSSHLARELLSDDPQVLLLTAEGIDAFVMRAAKRIVDEHSDEILFNCCPRCGALAKTPKARQCRFCRHDWH